MKNKYWILAGLLGGILGSILIYLIDNIFYFQYTIPAGLLISCFGMVMEELK